MASFASVSIRFSADLKNFSTSIQNAQRQMQKVGKQMQSVGKNLTLGLTVPITALGIKSVQAFDKQAKAIAQVEAGVKSTGQAAGFATEQLLKMASDLQNKTIFGDEEILFGATSQLLTFTNIAGEQFERTQLAALNLATRLDGDLKSASIQLGKALNDPVANLSALSRSGIQFSKDQTEVIKQLANTNRLAEAQTIILDELETQYGGAAEAAAMAGTGPFKQLSNVLGDIMEDFGAIISEALLPFISKLKDLADRFKNLDPAIKKTIVTVAALAAAIGPVLATMGFMVANIIPAMAAGFTALTGPVGLVIAAISGIAYAVYQNWPRIKKEFNELRNYFIDLYNESIVFRAGLETVIHSLKGFYNVAKFVIDAFISGFGNAFEFVISSFKNFGRAFKAVLTGDLEEIPRIIADQTKLAVKRSAMSLVDLSKDISVFSTNMKADIADAVDSVTLRKKVAFSEANVDASAIQNVVNAAVIGGLSGGTRGRAQVESVNSGIASENIEFGEGSDFQSFVEAFIEAAQKLGDIQDQVVDKSKDFAEQLGAVVENGAERFLIGFGELIGNFANGGLTLQSITNLMLTTLADIAIQVGTMAIKIGVAVEAIKTALTSLAGPVAIAAGVALIALGTFAKNALSGAANQNYQTPRVALASGGIAYSPVNALIGEYPGASRNPEVVAPLDKLRGMIADVSGGGQIPYIATARVSGQDLLIGMEAAQKYRDRRG